MRPALMVLCLVVLLPFAAAGGENLLPNGDFGQGLAGWDVRSASGTLTAELVAGENDCLHFVDAFYYTETMTPTQYIGD